MLITADGHAVIRKLVESKLKGEAVLRLEDPEDDVDLFGSPLPQPYDYMPGVRAIPVSGPIGYKISAIEKVCGVCDIAKVNQWTREAMNDASVDTLLYIFDTPGGECTGLTETAELIAECGKTKNTIAFSDTMACSAGMWLFAACNETYSTLSADLMSVGVYSYLLDYSEAYKAQGVSVETFTSGDLKGIGIPGRALSDAQREHLQAEVDELGATFRGWMKQQMPAITDDMMRGQSVSGEKVAKAGITSGLVSTMDEIFMQ